jgi:CHAT domain-containing protein
MDRKYYVILFFLVVSCVTQSDIRDESNHLETIRNRFQDPERVSASSDSDFAPDVSSDGYFLYFTADRYGNKDIMKKSVNGGVASFLTTHVADDFKPVLSPDGKQIAYVSRRDDALGDIYFINSDGGLQGSWFGVESSIKDGRIARPESEDSGVSWFPDGLSLVFTAKKPGEDMPEILRFDLRTRTLSGFDGLRGSQPSVSSDGKRIVFVRQGALYLLDVASGKSERLTSGGVVQDGHPRFAKNDSDILFIRYIDDTNGDGSLNGDDHPTIWRLPFLGAKKHPSGQISFAEPISSAKYGAYSPLQRGKWVYAAMETGDGINIYRLPSNGHYTGSHSLAEFNEDLASTQDSWDRIFLRRKQGVYLLKQGDQSGAAEMYLSLLRMYVTQGRSIEATVLAGAIRDLFSADIVALKYCDLEMLRLQIVDTLYPKIDRDLSLPERSRIENVRKILESIITRDSSRTRSDDVSAQRIQYATRALMAEVMAADRNFVGALKVLGALKKPKVPDQAVTARAAMLEALLARELRDDETSINMLIQVIRDFKEDREVVQEASQYAIFLAKGDENSNESLRKLIQEARGLPMLPALAHWEIAKGFDTAEKQPVYANELREIVQSYPESPQIQIDAARRLSSIDERLGRFSYVEAMWDHLRHVAKISAHGSFRNISSEFLNFYLRWSESLKVGGSYEESLQKCQLALSIDSQSINAHRCIIDVSYKLGRYREQIEYYERITKEQKDSQLYNYLLAYSLTYEVDTTRDVGQRISVLERVIYILENVVKDLGQVSQVHQTLGWAYLQKNHWTHDRAAQGGWLEQLRKRASMVVDSIRAGRSSLLERSIDAFESAYYLSPKGSLDRTLISQNLGQAFYSLKSYQKSLDYLLARIATLDVFPLQERRQVGLLFRRAGRAAFQADQMELASKLQKEALRTWERLGDDEQIAYSLDALALTLREMGQFKEALTLYENLKNIEDRKGNTLNRIGVYANLAYCQFSLDRNQSALDSFDASEKIIQESLQVSSNASGSGQKESDAIKVDLGGEGSSAKGFDIFSRQNLILAFKGMIYERMDRLDLAIDVALKRKVLLENEAKKSPARSGSGKFLQEARAILSNQIAYLNAKIGESRKSAIHFQESITTIRETKEKNDTQWHPVEIAGEIALGRIHLRLLSLEVLEGREAASEVDRIKQTLSSLDLAGKGRDFDVSEAKFELAMIGEGLQSIAKMPVDKEFKERIRNLLSDASTSSLHGDPQGVRSLNLMQLMPELKDSLLPSETEGEDSKENDHGVSQASNEWARLAVSGDHRAALEQLIKFVDSGGILGSPLNRLSARRVFEGAMDQMNPKSKGTDSIEIWRKFIRLRMQDLARRGQLIKDVKDPLVEAKEGKHQTIPGVSDSVDLATLQAALGDHAVLLLAHRTLSGGLYLGLIHAQGTLYSTARIASFDANTIATALRESGFMQAMLGKSQLYLVPDSELFDFPWENIPVGGGKLQEQFEIGYIPSPDILVQMIVGRPYPKSRMFILGSPENPDIPWIGQKGSVDSYDIAHMSMEQVRGIQESSREYDMVHIAEVLNLNDSEPFYSSFSSVKSRHDSPKEGSRGMTLLEICRRDWHEKSIAVLTYINRSTSNYLNNLDAHDGWAYIALCAAQMGTPTVFLSESPIAGDLKKTSRGVASVSLSASDDWANFYSELPRNSIASGVRKSGLRGRILGDLGLSQSLEKRLALSNLARLEEAADDSYDDGDFAHSVMMFRKALYLAQKTQDQDVLGILGKIVSSYFQLRDYKTALYYQEQKLRHLKLDPQKKSGNIFGETLVEASVIAVKAQEFDTARRILDEAESFFGSDGSPELLGKIDQYRAISAENQGQYQTSIDWYQKARSHYANVNSLEAANRMLNIGNIYNARLSDFPRALQSYEVARSEFRKVDAKAEELRVLVDICSALISMGELQRAIEILENDLIPHVDRTKDLDLWVRSNQMLANAFLRIGSFDESEELNDLTIAVSTKIEDSKSQDKKYQRLVDALNLKAYLLAARGQYAEAFSEFDKAIVIATDKRLDQQLATLFNNYGFWMREVGSSEKSIELLERAEEIDKRLMSRAGLAVDWRNLGLSLLTLGHLSRAKDLLERSLSESEALSLSYNIAFCRFGLGDLALREKQLPLAEQQFEMALKISQKGLMPDFEWRALAGIGRVRILLGRGKEAIDPLSLAISKIEEREGGLKSEASKTSFQSDSGTQEVYALYAKALMDDGQTSLAWEVSERSKSRALVDALGSSRLHFSSLKTVEFRRKERESRNRLGEAYRTQKSKGINEETADNVAKARKQYDDVLNRIRLEDPQLADLIRVENVSAADFLKFLPKDMVLVSYMVTPSSLLMWSLRGGKIKGFQVPVGALELERRVRDYRSLFENFSSTNYLGGELYEILIKPLKEDLSDVKNIVFSPHRSLHFLSFASLPSGDGYLLDTAPISYIESARLGEFLWGKSRSRQPLGPTSRIIALVDPSSERENVPSLPFARKEADVMGRYFKSVTRFENERASMAVLQRGTAQYDVLHLATHGEFFPSQPSESRLLLAGSQQKPGHLTVRDVLALPRQARIVTLSACESGLGVASNGDDIVSMDRAFFYVGARTVVSSLWRISDVASAVLMKRFYRNLADGLGPAEALHKAQVTVRKYFSHPSYWASFRLLGEGT